MAEPKSADTVTDPAKPQHPESRTSKLAADQKAGPASVQSSETRPDERDLKPGTSALQA
jgi:hypothetical protein